MKGESASEKTALPLRWVVYVEIPAWSGSSTLSPREDTSASVRRMNALEEHSERAPASELLVLQLIPSREAAYGFPNVPAGLFDLLHVEPS